MSYFYNMVLNLSHVFIEMVKRIIRFLLLFLIALGSASMEAQEQFVSRYNISYVTMDDGLLHNNIDYIYKDKLGFLWIATAGGGLSRYDGYDFIHFNTNTAPVSISSNFIVSVCEDKFGRLWVVSGEGTDIIDLKTLRITKPVCRLNKFDEIVQQPAVNVINDTRGNIWLYSGSSLHRISFEDNGDIASISSSENIPIVAFFCPIEDLDGDGNVWIGFGSSIRKVFTTDGGELEMRPISPVLNERIKFNIHTFCLKENEVWIATNGGLYRYNRNEEIIKSYHYRQDVPRSISQNHISDIAVTKDRQLVVSTLQGMNIYNPVTDDFERVSHDERQNGISLNSNFINCMLVDNDIVWVGSATGGISKIKPRQLLLRSYVNDENDPYSLSQNIVNAICEDRDGNLWVGTVEGGLNRKDRDSDRFINYTMQTPLSLSHNTISSLIVDNRNRLWAGTWGWGITVIDLNDRNYRVVKYINTDEDANFRTSFVGSLCYDPHNDGVWIGANPGIYFYDFATEKIITPIAPDIVNNTYSPLGALAASDGMLWMGSIDGLFVIDLHSRRGDKFDYRQFKYKLDEPESGITERITCFHEMSDNTIWIGSNGNGIYKCMKEGADYRFECYNTKHGLINNNVLGILEDDNGLLWISTNYGLSCFDPVNESFVNFTKDDGIINNQFYWNAFCKPSDGKMYFGGLNGLIAIDGINRESANTPAKVTFTRLRVKNEDIRAGDKGLTTDISMAEALHLHESDNSFSLEFSSLNYESQATAVYSYRLSGFEDGWTDVSFNRRFAGYTNIPPGKYALQVRYTIDGNFANSDITELDIVISPFFYKTWWFICLLIFVIGCVIIYSYIYRLHELQKQKQLLRLKVEERTRELLQQNEKISRQKAQLIEMSKKVQELTLDKLSFFTNITHEFRTPITLIIGPIERALKLSSNPQVIEQLNFVKRNSKYLLSLINQLMDFRKVESGKFEIIKTNGDFIKFIDSLIVPFEAFAFERKISIRRFYRMDDPMLLFDQDSMHKVISNLLSNAIKFTPDGGTVSLYIASCQSKDDGKEKIFIGVRDTGTGVSEEDISRIFNRFYQSRNNTQYLVYGQSGTGIGLYLCKHIVMRHGGVITARNNKNKGCMFLINLPLLRDNAPRSPFAELMEQSSTEKAPDSPPHFKSGRLAILIVEDNRDMRGYIRSVLEGQYNILEAENGVEALALLNNNNVDFIISDLMMPAMDGLELSRKVKQNFTTSHIPFLMLTAKTSQEARLESYRTGVDEFLQKPFGEELLLTRINNIFENRKRHQQRFSMNMEVRELHIEEESSDKKFLDKAIETICANYKNSYYESVDFVEAMGASKSVVNKKIQSLTGQSIGQFIRNYRLNVAYEMIKKNKITRNMNISEIAYEVGFNDPKYFTRCFTKRYNVPPSGLME